MSAQEGRTGVQGVSLTRVQQRMLALHRVHPQADMLARAFLLRGKLDLPALASAVAWSANKGPVLSSVIAQDGAAATRRPGECIALQVQEPERRDSMDAAIKALQEVIARPFDLARGPLLRVVIVPITDQTHLFLFHAHHIVVDGYSIALGLKHVIEGYARRLQGGSLDEEQAEDGLARIALAEADHARSEAGRRDAAYWSARLAPAPAPARCSRGGRNVSLASAVCSTQLDPGEHALVARAAQLAGTTRPGMYAAAFQQVLETVQPGSALSTTFTLRRNAASLRVVGPLMTYGLLTAPRTREPYLARARRLGAEISAGQVHARGADTVGPHGPEADALPLHRTALISFHVQKRFAQLSLGFGAGACEILSGLALESVSLPTRFVPYGLFLSVGEIRGEAAILLVYNRELYAQDQAQAILREVRGVLLSAATRLCGGRERAPARELAMVAC